MKSMHTMRKGLVRWMLPGLMVAGLAQPVVAQSQARGPSSAGSRHGAAPADRPASGDTVRIGDLVGTGRRTLVRTPEYRTNAANSAPRAKEWAQILVTFDTTPEWLDVVTLEFHVMAMSKQEGKTRYSIYRLNVDILDVARGRDHLCPVFLPPSAVERYGLPVATHVTALVKGKKVDSKDDTEASMKDLPPDWWENRAVIEKENVTVRDGYLLRLSATPFALVNSDAYEVMR